MLVHFIHTGVAYLPELSAYSDYLRSAGHTAVICRKISDLPVNAKIIWWMCGRVPTATQGLFPNAFHVHEYASASTPPLAWLKDSLKQLTQATPQYRIYQNEWVRVRIGFSDNTPYEYRDMGVASYFLGSYDESKKKEFDFVYLGEMHRLSGFRHALHALNLSGKSLLLIGEVSSALAYELRHFPNVHYAGRITHKSVPSELQRARIGLNLVPNQIPFSEQTSTKLLEYCAVGLPVASTDYKWVRHFSKQAPTNFFWLPQSQNIETWCAAFNLPLENYPFITPDVRNLLWDQKIGAMSIWKRLIGF